MAVTILTVTKGEIMKTSIRHRTGGAFHEVKGTIKEKAGKLTNNPSLEGEGKVEKITGKLQKKLGQVERVFEKL